MPSYSTQWGHRYQVDSSISHFFIHLIGKATKGTLEESTILHHSKLISRCKDTGTDSLHYVMLNFHLWWDER